MGHSSEKLFHGFCALDVLRAQRKTQDEASFAPLTTSSSFGVGLRPILEPSLRRPVMPLSEVHQLLSTYSGGYANQASKSSVSRFTIVVRAVATFHRGLVHVPTLEVGI